MARILSSPTWDQMSDGSQRYVGPIIECDCGKFVACNLRSGNHCKWCDSRYDAAGKQEFQQVNKEVDGYEERV